MEGERHDTKRQGEADGGRSAEKAMMEGRDCSGGRKKGEEDEQPAQTASRQRLLAISRHSQRTLATWEGFVKLRQQIRRRLYRQLLASIIEYHKLRQRLTGSTGKHQVFPGTR